jgi:hypothetical protein
MLYRGRLGWILYIPLRRATFRTQSYLLCGSKTWCILYIGKGTTLGQCYKDFPLLSQIILILTKQLLGKGYCLTNGSYYSSPQVADTLTGNKADSYGSVLLNRKEVPTFL